MSLPSELPRWHRCRRLLTGFLQILKRSGSPLFGSVRDFAFLPSAISNSSIAATCYCSAHLLAFGWVFGQPNGMTRAHGEGRTRWLSSVFALRQIFLSSLAPRSTAPTERYGALR